ncbi:hypothetical protein WT27_13385 [Burkholderia territorii]|uniref:Uncharacterized protein n=1 Tax=Burkholderia territorii TaxID=1503055 RepID=A0A119APC2_9BURK|nr:hypothetical protein [Burkholderia territorii]KVV40913.1 hypothetical protein WT27_13385 [Burkholderia territorii]KVX33860.1 hypothetical protein WT31_09285 [Burkholderia territorii]
MSYRIEYQARAFRVPKHLVNERAFEDYFLFAVEGGDNNLIDVGGRPVRSWSALAFDVKYHVMEEVVRAAMYCEAGNTKWLGRDIRPENYIRIMRRVVDEAPSVESLPGSFQLQADLRGFDTWDMRNWKEKVLTAPDADVFWEEAPTGKVFGELERRWDYRSQSVALEGGGIALYQQLRRFDKRHISAQVRLSLPSSSR